MNKKFNEFTNSSSVVSTTLCDCVKSFAPVEAEADGVHVAGVSGYFLVYKEKSQKVAQN